MTRWPPPPTLSASFFKGHGLGNDYLVFAEGRDWTATPGNVRRVCDPHRGLGSDGIVVISAHTPGEHTSGAERSPIRARMFNPDGGEFERSGNGLRILAAYLMQEGDAADTFDAEVGGSRVRLVGHGRAGPAYDVSVDMGCSEVGPAAVGLDPRALDGEGRLPGPGGEWLRVVPVSVGNPHLVVLCEDEAQLLEDRLRVIGPYLSEHPAIAHGTNVQLALHEHGHECRALVWERGVGRTAASGTSACAVAVAMVSTERIAPGEVQVRMPGGTLRVVVDDGLEVTLRGPVEEIAHGRLSERLLSTFEPGS
ncbi:MAG: diaminopimelate epimerase [Gemmatimonadota bacterium]|nr:diaminopimelate epimerase [Gemmatimonadota bacterium]